jgi:GT2 family glycosyltransferase
MQTFSHAGVPPKVGIVILNWNGLSDTLECLTSVRRLAYTNVDVIVVDNGSHGDDARQIEDCDVVSTVVRSPVNLGYAGGSNLGIRTALQRGADYVWLLNNDAIIEPDSLTKLVAFGERYTRIGLLSPVIYHYETPESVQLTGTRVDLERQTYRILRSIDEADIGPRGEGFALAGTALLIKRKALECIGGFDERFFAYVEDTDYSTAAMAAGFDTALVREARVYHKYGRSLGGRESPERDYLFTRNMYLFWTKHLKGRLRRITLPVKYVAWVLEGVVDARNRGQHVSAAYISAGGWDALRGHWGSWENRGKPPRWVETALTRSILKWHPYFWIALLHGNWRRIAREALARLLRGRA